MYDVILKGGTVVDGTGNPRFKADIGITDGVIRDVKDLSGQAAQRVVDVLDYIVAPGWIDAVSHVDTTLSLMRTPDCASLVHQGITTVIGGACGTSLAPLALEATSKTLRKRSRFREDAGFVPSSVAAHASGVAKWADTAFPDVSWLTFSEYADVIQSQVRPAVSVGSYVGFGTLRRIAVRDYTQPAMPQEIELMERLLNEALEQGAVGLSAGLNFTHEVYASTQELQALARVAKQHERVLVVHMNSEQADIRTSVQELIALSQQTGVRLLIAHLKPVGPEATRVYADVLSDLKRAVAAGVDVHVSAYPYALSYVVLTQYIPAWIRMGGWKKMLEQFNNESSLAKLLRALEPQESWFGDLIVARTKPLHTRLVGRSMRSLAVDWDCSIAEAVVQVLKTGEGYVLCMDPSIHDEAVEHTLQLPFCLAIAESVSHRPDEHSAQRFVSQDQLPTQQSGIPHPRVFGAYPRLMAEYVRTRGALTLEEAVQKSSSLPAVRLGLHDRGFIAPDLRADLVVFDPEHVQDTATLHTPFRTPTGIEYVLVGGSFVIERGQQTSVRNGGFLRLLS